MDGTQAFKEFLENRGAAKNTKVSYVRDMQHFSNWFEETNGEALTMENLTPVDLRQYRQSLIASRLEPSTVNRRLAALRCFGSMLKDQGGENPASELRGIERQELAPKWLDKKVQTALIRQVERQVITARTGPAKMQAIRDQAAVKLILNTGLRVSEICGMEMDDVILGDRSGMVRVRNGKGEKSRKLPLNKTARAALRLWLQIRPEDSGKGFWCSKAGNGLTPSAFERRLRIIGRKAGVEATPHVLRHTFAKNLVDAGVGLERVAALLGHVRLETTRIYVIPSENDLEKSVELLDM